MALVPTNLQVWAKYDRKIIDILYRDVTEFFVNQRKTGQKGRKIPHAT
jgi:hypothetical protein